MIKKLTLCALSVIAALPLGFSAQAADGDLQLQQVLMLSRHNLRAPLADNGSVLAQATKKSWPQWDVPGGELTTKGGVLEVYMGRYTRAWLAQQGLLKANACPDSNEVFAYANSLQRTVATAQYFVTGAFPGCDVAVTHQDEMGTMDPVFSPVITNDSDEFNKKALAAMNAEGEKLSLKPAFQQLEKIIDYKNSPACDGKKQCTLSSDNQNKFSAENGKEPNVAGPLKVGNSLVDAFTLQYYQGFPLEQIAWGQIKTPEQWQTLSAIKNGYQDALFTSPEIAREVASPLIDYIRSQLIDQDKASAPKVMLMVGHDSNIASLLAALDVKPYTLPGQYEKTPIGGQVVFERWHDAKADKDLVKIEYVYQTADQLRDGEVLSLKNPPQRVTLQLNGCPTDGNGFCSWEQFNGVLNAALQGTALQPAAEKPSAPAANDAAATDKAATDNAATDKAAQAKAAADKAAQEKAAAADKAAKEKAAAEKAAADKAAQEKAAAADKAAKEKAAADKAAQEKAAAADKAAKEKAAAEKAAAEKAEPASQSKPQAAPEAQTPADKAQQAPEKEATPAA
ncbi:bifunctional glucose-1-phosphatase/inositol phosphatase [Mixta calida]|uniref:bifunctional glucose-1-phosphatase/inositol phosphatase n=1 Tax=Mixta calida TaxID=665913 RepID=UPI0028A0F366|nr:bifunctional glucose-1-phosphatase/inositol phosphatase [Mixta calida]MBS6056862.1 bifunctional glucose-1-phosphatase/inositol phosphatase [Pantoea sp.]MDU5767458.1 bifunctional glucose-1-phosphatase/inositol phosphatase [Mixta calida]MDU5826283.1 bifunctional glucose-1-phosphatase/inositol phosphatase [Mixta calida]MDU6413109.1 bifunctional glucose-1-phosphatase/inositol phosphatase [Mixta calida]